MSKLKLGDMLAEKLNISTEDNAQVEVNFNIDTDENGAPIDDVPVETNVDDTEEEDQNAVDASESENEADTAEADMDQLQEAQDSLESIGLVLNKHAEAGTLSASGLGFYQIALESIAGAQNVDDLGLPSLESHSYTKHHATVVALEAHQELTRAFDTISMEAKANWLRKVIHKIDVLFRGEKALLKRAKGLNAIADTSSGEHSSNGNLKVNASKSVSLPTLLTQKWDSEHAFLTHVKEFTSVYNAMTTVKGGFDDDFVDNLFPGSDKWTQRDGKPTKTIFGLRLVRDGLIKGYTAEPVTSETTVPNLTPAAAKAVLKELITLLEHGDLMHDNCWTMFRIMEKAKVVKTSTSKTTGAAVDTETAKTTISGSETTNEEVTYPEGYQEMYETMAVLSELKNKVVTEILNYVNFSLTDREFN